MSAQNVIKQRETKKRFTRKIKDGLQKKKKNQINLKKTRNVQQNK